MTKLNRTNRKDVTLAAALWLALMGLLLLSAAPDAAVDKDSLKVMDKLQRLEDAYSNATLKTRRLAKSDFVSFLITNLEHPSRSVRRRATYLTNVYFADDPQVLARLVDLLEPDRFAELPVQARINAMHLVANAGKKAWELELLERATESIRQIGIAPPDAWAAQQEKYYTALRIRIVVLAAFPSSIWAFGTVQERDTETKGLTDVDVFVCEDSREDKKIVDQARRLASLVAEREFGRVRLRVWTSDKDTPLDELKPHSTVFFDEKHPEENEVLRVEKALSEVEGLPPFRALPNSGRPSPWYLSVVICPSRPAESNEELAVDIALEEELAVDITPEDIQKAIDIRKTVGATSCDVVTENNKRFLICLYPKY